MENINPETQEAEVVVPGIETAPDAGGLVVVNEAKANELQYLADNIDKMIDSHIKVRSAILRLAQPGDWSLWGKRAELGFAGANRIGSTLGVSFGNWSSEKVSGHDENGDWYRWEYQCEASYAGRRIRVYGRAGSRDILFGFENGKWKELSNVNEGNIKVAAMRAAKKEGIKDLFGLHGLDPAFLKTKGINLDSAGGHSFKNKDDKAAEVQTINMRIDSVTVKNGDGWNKYTIKDAEGAVYTTFSDTVAAEAKKVVADKTTAKIDFKANANPKYAPDVVSINGITGSK